MLFAPGEAGASRPRQCRQTTSYPASPQQPSCRPDTADRALLVTPLVRLAHSRPPCLATRFWRSSCSHAPKLLECVQTIVGCVVRTVDALHPGVPIGGS